MMSISKVSIVKALSLITMVVALSLGIISNISTSASAQDSSTTKIVIVSGARLSQT
jgi:hypothetical protein